MRTLVISDLHLGAPAGRDVLRRPAALHALQAEIARSDRLVLLGDTIELLDTRPDRARPVAAEILPQLTAALPAGGEVVLVPGNHDHALVSDWVQERLRSGRSLPPSGRVPHRASPLLEELCRNLRPARVEVRYPGVWLAPRVWATHGHYVDRHLLAALAAATGIGGRGAAAERADAEPAVRASVADYEGAAGIDIAALQRMLATSLPDPFAAGAVAAAGAARRALIASLPRIGPATRMRGASVVWASLLEHGHARRGALPAMAQVAARLGIDADAVIFGHIHRRGPLASDPPSLWRPAGGAGPRLFNTGSWVWDPALRGRQRGPRPYRPGGAVVVAEGRAPRAIDVLAELPDREFEQII